MIKKAAVLTIAGIALVATTAVAAVTFDPATGAGFVGKGDVQIAFGWNNAALQRNAAGVTFAYNGVSTYSAVCSWTTGEGTPGERTHEVTHSTRSGVEGSIAYEARTKNQINGFNLDGYSGAPVTTGGSIPVVGDPCHGNAGHDGVWTDVDLTGTGGGLEVSHGVDTHQLQ
jgi:hypothetical protein